jgi:hypothetical protein
MAVLRRRGWGGAEVSGGSGLSAAAVPVLALLLALLLVPAAARADQRDGRLDPLFGGTARAWYSRPAR